MTTPPTGWITLTSVNGGVPIYMIGTLVGVVVANVADNTTNIVTPNTTYEVVESVDAVFAVIEAAATAAVASPINTAPPLPAPATS